MKNKFSRRSTSGGNQKPYGKGKGAKSFKKNKQRTDDDFEGFVKKKREYGSFSISLKKVKKTFTKKRRDNQTNAEVSGERDLKKGKFIPTKSESKVLHSDNKKLKAEIYGKKNRALNTDKIIKRQVEKEGTYEYQEEHINLFDKSDTIRLNKYIANAGICARRVADEHIAAGEVTVNGEVITAMGYRVKPGDVVTFQGRVVQPGKKVYILLNKPKDYVTTTDDERGRRTVLDLIKGVTEERIYPVGRLDRNTTGLLLLTNDGELAQKLTHPSYEVRKVYHVVLNKNISREELEQIKNGIELEDGIAEVDDVDYAGTGLKNEVGIELHSGKNRIVRRIFEHLGFEVIALDRVLYAGLTKKDIPRGHWRYLTDKEILRLKHFVPKKPKPRRET